MSDEDGMTGAADAEMDLEAIVNAVSETIEDDDPDIYFAKLHGHAEGVMGGG